MLGSKLRVLGMGLGLGLFWACSSDDSQPAHPSGSSGEGGEGGESAGKGGGAGRAVTAGRGGTTSTSGQGGEGGEPPASGGKGGAGTGGGAGTITNGAGEGGAGGEGGAAPAPGMLCTTCAETACDDELSRCERSPSCRAWLGCVNACDGATCAQACDAQHPELVLLTTAVYQCLCTSSCDDECADFDACDRTCVEGAGPSGSSANTAPPLLSDTGLYTRVSTTDPWTLAPYVQAFQPAYELWSDGAVKERYIYLPRCQTIDSTDLDHWSFPVGTRIWKQFTRDGVRVETRLLWRFGTGVSDWVMAAYQWPLPVGAAALDPELATLASDQGVANVNGTAHDIPALLTGCDNCHGKLSERVLGFSAIQLSHALSGLKFSDLADRGVLSNAPVRDGYDPPGDATAQAALGYLHANCGNCHNPTGQATGPTSMWLRLLVGNTTVASTHAVATAVNVPTFNGSFMMDRIEPTAPSQSSIIVRMQRDPSMMQTQQMPPVGRELPDPTGIARVSAWITSLSP